MFGFLGPNGAGKTTAIRLLMGLIRPTGGEARVFGLDCWREAVAVKRRVGYLPGELPDWGGLRGDEVVAALAGLRGGVDPGRVAALCRRLELDLGQPWREMSRGTRQKLALVLAWMHRPDLLLLDEPTGGLDPLHQQTFYALVGEARAGGATVFLSSHDLAEVEHVCDRAGIVRAGRLVAVLGLGELRGLRARRVEIAFAGPPPAGAVRAARAWRAWSGPATGCPARCGGASTRCCGRSPGTPSWPWTAASRAWRSSSWPTTRTRTTTRTGRAAPAPAAPSSRAQGGP